MKTTIEQFERLKKSMVRDLRRNGDKPFLIRGDRSWTTYQLADEIETGTDFGVENLNSLIMLSIDLISRGKKNFSNNDQAPLWDEVLNYCADRHINDIRVSEYLQSKFLIIRND